MTTRRGMREARRLRSRRIRAVLASGLVFGVGAAMTLAAWNDSEHTNATFTAGRFGIVGAVDGVTFSEHPAAPGATLNFAVAPAAMVPGTTTYALFSVRTTPSSVAGNLQLSASATPGGTGLAAHLTYGVRVIPAATAPAATTCNSATYNAATDPTAVVVPAGSALTTGATASRPISANGGATVNYCFAVTLPITAPNAAQGLTMSQTWQILGTAS
ncbi:MAG TPA: SipW-dependent-type signal peptide-containing protein [Microbacterium sp.]|nr:SipW-dependent-type signal peptide-containing protein [Microbacterium sp.]